MNKLTFLFFALIALLLAPERHLACQCVTPALDTEGDFSVAVSTSLDRADAVFSGEVTEMDRFTIKFSVQGVWKGNMKEEVTLATGAYIGVGGLVISSRCGPQFEAGKSYLVFARGPEGKLQAERCSWTGLLSDSERVVGELDGLRRMGMILWRPITTIVGTQSNNSFNRSAIELECHRELE